MEDEEERVAAVCRSSPLDASLDLARQHVKVTATTVARYSPGHSWPLT